MRLADRTYSVLDIPLSGTEFWAGVALCGALALVLLALPTLGRWGMTAIGGLR